MKIVQYLLDYIEYIIGISIAQHGYVSTKTKKSGFNLKV